MTRRAAAGFGRLLPLLLISAALIVVVGAALLAACGGSSGGVSPTPTATVTVTTTPSASTPSPASPSASPSATPMSTQSLYFLRSGKLGVATRQIATTTMPATAAVKALLAGPNAAEQTAGLSTAVRPGLRLLGLVIADGVATADLSKAPGDDPAVAELVYTLTRFPTVSAVRLKTDGNLWMDSSTSTPSTFRRADFRALEPAIFVERPGVGAVVSSPFTLSGTASVFEGSFQARLVDSSGRRIVNVIVQASRGAPGRGSFSKEIAFSTSAARGTLIVFSQSMEDGSRQNEVRVPVTFAAN